MIESVYIKVSAFQIAGMDTFINLDIENLSSIVKWLTLNIMKLKQSYVESS